MSNRLEIYHVYGRRWWRGIQKQTHSFIVGLFEIFSYVEAQMAVSVLFNANEPNKQCLLMANAVVRNGTELNRSMTVCVPLDAFVRSTPIGEYLVRNVSDFHIWLIDF